MRFHTGHTGAGHDSHIQMRHKEKGTVIQDRLLSFHSQAASFFRVKSSMQRIDQGIQLFVAVMAIIFAASETTVLVKKYSGSPVGAVVTELT